ncbi:MAG: SDR family oxidoreductase [Bellilinea sp.]|nr:SDR family oxidoreductase [Bellilinea sp.]
MMRILVTGASGLLGLNFALRYHADHQVSGVVHRNPLNNPPFQQIVADLSDAETLQAVLDQSEPEVVLHCAALANVDECERNPQRAFQVNVALPAGLARLAARDGFRLVHLSTDAVFDGQRGDYTEEDTPNPLSVYARTKWQAEQQVLETCPQALVARVNFYGWSLSGQRSLGEFFYYNLKQGRGVKGFTDVIFCPLEATQLADLLLRLVEKGAAGLYHVVSSECQSKYAFGVSIARRFGLDESLIEPVSVMEGGLVARRSPNLRLRTDKLAATLGEPPPGQAAALDRFYQLFLAGYPQQIRSLADGRVA